MEATILHKLAYLLALRDFSDTLNEQEQATLKTVGEDLNLQPKAWETHIEPLLLKIIQGNTQFNKSYQFYQDKLAQLRERILSVLPTAEDINQLSQLLPNQPNLVPKGFIPESSASGYEQQLDNVVIVINQTDKPEEAAKKLGFLDQVKQKILNLG